MTLPKSRLPFWWRWTHYFPQYSVQDQPSPRSLDNCGWILWISSLGRSYLSWLPTFWLSALSVHSGTSRLRRTDSGHLSSKMTDVLTREVKVKVAQSCPILCDPTDHTVHGILQARMLEWVAFPFFRDLSNPGIEPRSSTLQADSLPAEPQGKSKNTGVGSLSCLQQIFPTQELNQGLLHCRQILY